MKVTKLTKGIFAGIGVLFLVAFLLLWFTSHQLAALQQEAVNCREGTPLLQAGQQVNVFTWNLRHTALAIATRFDMPFPAVSGRVNTHYPGCRSRDVREEPRDHLSPESR